MRVYGVVSRLIATPRVYIVLSISFSAAYRPSQAEYYVITWCTHARPYHYRSRSSPGDKLFIIVPGSCALSSRISKSLEVYRRRLCSQKLPITWLPQPNSLRSAQLAIPILSCRQLAQLNGQKKQLPRAPKFMCVTFLLPTGEPGLRFTSFDQVFDYLKSLFPILGWIGRYS